MGRYDAFVWIIKLFVTYLICFHISSIVLVGMGKEPTVSPIPLDTIMFIWVIGLGVLVQIIFMIMDMYSLKFKRIYVPIKQLEKKKKKGYDEITPKNNNNSYYPVEDNDGIPFWAWAIAVIIIIFLVLLSIIKI